MTQTNNKAVQNLANLFGEAKTESHALPQTEHKSEPVTAPAPAPATPVAYAPVEDASVAALKSELLALELEEKKLNLQFQRANLVDMQERLDERELKRETVRQRSINNGSTLKALANNDRATQERCNHRKGGQGAQGVVAGQGESQFYAVINHTFANGDRIVTCTRCHKLWKPPVKGQFTREEDYLDAHVEYKTALSFPTDNKPSGSVQFRFSDGGANYREQTANVTIQ